MCSSHGGGGSQLRKCLQVGCCQCFVTATQNQSKASSVARSEEETGESPLKLEGQLPWSMQSSSSSSMRDPSQQGERRSDSPKLSFVLHSHIMARGPTSLVSKLINKNKAKRSTFLLVSWPQLNKHLYVHLMIFLIKQINTSQSCLLALICSNNTCEKCWTSFYTPQISVMIIKRTTHLFK